MVRQQLSTQRKMMFELFVFFCTCSTVTAFLSPRVFRWSDSSCTRQRLHTNSVPQARRQVTTHQQSVPIDQFFDSLARSIRSHVPPRDALLKHAHLLPTTSMWVDLVAALHRDVHLSSSIDDLRSTHHEDGQLLAMAFATNGFNADALEYAAHLARERRHVERSLIVATAQARLTMRILTWLPFAVLIIGVLTSSSVRSVLPSPAAIVLLGLGILLNRLGAWWVTQSIRRSIHLHQLPQSVSLVESLCVALRAGHSPMSACAAWETINPLGQHVAQLLREGATLTEALRPLATTEQQFDSLVAHTLATAHVDGLPLHTAASLLATEARKCQRAEIETHVQQLSTRLSLPLVFCVLPSFGLLTLAPMLLAHLSHFSSALPSPIS